MAGTGHYGRPAGGREAVVTAERRPSKGIQSEKSSVRDKNGVSFFSQAATPSAEIAHL